MKIALIGASGFIGQHILQEARSRQHQVTALVRDTSKIPQQGGVIAKTLDSRNPDAVTAALTGHDAAIISFHYLDVDFQTLINAVKASSVKRFLVVGGAGSLEVAPGVRVIDTPDFPEEWKAVAHAAIGFLDALRAEKNLDWVYVSPSAFIEPGQRTGKFRIGSEQLLVDEKGESRISNQDFAVAVIDELEQPQHHQQRFTVGY